MISFSRVSYPNFMNRMASTLHLVSSVSLLEVQWLTYGLVTTFWIYGFLRLYGMYHDGKLDFDQNSLFSHSSRPS